MLITVALKDIESRIRGSGAKQNQYNYFLDQMNTYGKNWLLKQIMPIIVIPIKLGKKKNKKKRSFYIKSYHSISNSYH